MAVNTLVNKVLSTMWERFASLLVIIIYENKENNIPGNNKIIIIKIFKKSTNKSLL